MGYVISRIGSKNAPIFVELKEFEGRKLIDLRKYFLDKNSNEFLPTRKGIALNAVQFSQLVETINNNQEIIEFLDHDDQQINEINITLKFDNLLGRSFKSDYENGSTTIIFDESKFSNIDSTKLDVIKKFIISLNNTLFEVLDEQSEIDLILDRLDYKLRNIQW